MADRSKGFKTYREISYQDALTMGLLDRDIEIEVGPDATRAYYSGGTLHHLGVSANVWWVCPEDDAACGRFQELLKDRGNKESAVLKVGKDLEGTDPGGLSGVERELLSAGQSKVDGERQEEHGDPVPNMERFAAMLSAYFGFVVTSHDAAMVQAIFKIVRSKANPSHADNYDDLEGYAEIGRRCAGLR